MGEENNFKNLSWQERILVIMQDGKWYTHKQIVEGLGLGFNQDQFTSIEIARGRSVFYYIKCLIKTGYIIRAHLPDGINIPRCKFVYKLKDPNKKFKIRNERNFGIGRARRLKNDLERVSNIKDQS